MCISYLVSFFVSFVKNIDLNSGRENYFGKAVAEKIQKVFREIFFRFYPDLL